MVNYFLDTRAADDAVTEAEGKIVKFTKPPGMSVVQRLEVIQKRWHRCGGL